MDKLAKIFRFYNYNPLRIDWGVIAEGLWND